MNTITREGFSHSYPAAADLSAKLYYGVKVNSSGQAALATTLGQTITGVLMNKPDAAGVAAQVMHQGIGLVEAGAAFTAGDELTVAADGQFVQRTSADQAFAAYALQTASAAGDQVSAYILPEPDPTLANGTDGRQRTGLLRFTYDFAEHGGAISTITLAETLPDNAIVTRSYYDVITTLTSATDAATVALGIATDDAAGIKAAVAISDGSNPWDAGYHEGIQTGAASAFSEKTTGERAIEVTIAVEAVTAGKFVGFLEYVISD